MEESKVPLHTAGFNILKDERKGQGRAGQTATKAERDGVGSIFYSTYVRTADSSLVDQDIPPTTHN